MHITWSATCQRINTQRHAPMRLYLALWGLGVISSRGVLRRKREARAWRGPGATSRQDSSAGCDVPRAHPHWMRQCMAHGQHGHMQDTLAPPRAQTAASSVEGDGHIVVPPWHSFSRRPIGWPASKAGQPPQRSLSRRRRRPRNDPSGAHCPCCPGLAASAGPRSRGSRCRSMALTSMDESLEVFRDGPREEVSDERLEEVCEEP